MHSQPNDHTGARIKRLRLERHLTQKHLADLSGVPYGTLTKVEQGVAPATPYITGRVADALKVEVATITGQPYLTELRADELDVLIRPIREALDVYDLGADPDITPRPHQLLADYAESLLVDVRAGEIKRVASKLGEMPSASGARPDRYAHQGLERDAPARFRRWPGLYRTSSARGTPILRRQ
ncbi:helix-turn-helix domain-containing protein [Streptomyces purpureus]|uniref:helix-turn-helix domain-containing protein n=1 Tax=Streptomyces purpureus TaxID=1951 RepID=UPI000365E5AC|nr:helix-turn-helix transcriptional regulator [Streptomyces purpureus]